MVWLRTAASIAKRGFTWPFAADARRSDPAPRFPDGQNDQRAASAQGEPRRRPPPSAPPPSPARDARTRASGPSGAAPTSPPADRASHERSPQARQARRRTCASALWGAAILAVATTFLQEPAALANPWDLYGFNARAIGMANAQTALADDFTAVYYNPAALTTRPYPDVGLGYTFAAPSLSISIARRDYDRRLEPLEPPNADGVTLGARVPLGGQDVAFGLALNIPTRSLLSGQAVDPGVPHWYVYQGLPRRAIVAFGGAVRPHPLISLGASGQLLGGLEGELEYQVDTVSGLFGSRSLRFDITPVLAPIVGLELGPYYGVRFGLVWRGPVESQFDLPLTLTLDGMDRLIIETLFTTQYYPHQLSTGFSITFPDGRWVLSVDATWSFWSAAPNPAQNSRVILDDRYVEPTETQDYVDLGFSDVFSPRAGFEYRLWQFTFRGGLAVRPSPAPRQTGITNYVDGLSWMFSLGAGAEVRGPGGRGDDVVSIDLGWSALWFPQRAHVKTSEDDAVGDFEASGAIYAIGLTIRYAFGLLRDRSMDKNLPPPRPWDPWGSSQPPKPEDAHAFTGQRVGSPSPVSGKLNAYPGPPSPKSLVAE